MHTKPLLWFFLVGVLAQACGSGSSNAPREETYRVIKPNEKAAQMSGISLDKEAEIQLLLQQRETSTRKCYQDVMNEKNDRKFQGTVKVLVSLDTGGRASAVKILGGTLGNKDVEDCLVATLKGFEYPQLSQPGDAQYEFKFRPAY